MLLIAVGGWLGLGITGEDSGMVNADFIVVRHDQANGAVIVDDRSSVKYETPLLDTELGGTSDVELIEIRAEQGSDMVTVTLRRPYAATNPGIDKEINQEANHISYAWGTGEFSYHAGNRKRSFIFFRTCGSEVIMENDDYMTTETMRVIHGVMMGTVWGLNLIIGVFVARYERHTTWWKGAHRLLQFMSTSTLYFS